MNESKRSITVVIPVLLLMGIALYFSRFGAENSSIAIGSKPFFDNHDKAFRNLNPKEITQLIDEQLSVLKEMEKTQSDNERRKELVDDISRFEDDLKHLTSNGYLNKDRLLPEITDSFIGRGPIMPFKTYSSGNDK